MKLDKPIFLPMGWFVAIVGASGTAILTAFSVGVWAATLSTKQATVETKVAKLEDAQPEVATRLTRIETILTYAYPEEARKAKNGN